MLCFAIYQKVFDAIVEINKLFYKFERQMFKQLELNTNIEINNSSKIARHYNLSTCIIIIIFECEC